MELDTEFKNETESTVTEGGNKETTSGEIIDKDDCNIDNNKESIKDIIRSAVTGGINLSNYFDETNFDDLRSACNETPTYEAWKTGQVPSPLKRGKSCKTPSPPPSSENTPKPASVPTTSRKARSCYDPSNGM